MRACRPPREKPEDAAATWTATNLVYTWKLKLRLSPSN